MRKAFIGSLALIWLLVSCAGMQTIQGRTETMVISYESIGTIGFPSVLAYLQQREKNGSLIGDALIKAKADYGLARSKFIKAGDATISIVQGTGTPVTPSTIALLLREVAIILADLSAPAGGQVKGNTLTVPVTGGIK